MRSSQRLTLLVAALAVLAAGFLLANSGSSPTKKTVVRQFNVVVADGKPVGGVAQLNANKGDTIDLKVTSNVAEEIHIHGYDFHKTVAAGAAAQFSFPASIDGKFVIELESRGEQIASLTVKT